MCFLCFLGFNQVPSSLKDTLKLEQDISQKERVEGTEIQKAEKIASRLKSTHNKHEETGPLGEELKEFVEAAKLFKNISEELHNTADDSNKTI